MGHFNSTPRASSTALWLAAENGNLAIVEFVLVRESKVRIKNKVLNRAWVLLLICCVPTVLVTTGVAYYLGAESVEVSPHRVVGGSGASTPLSPAVSAVRRDVARSMLPGTQAATSGGIVALVSYAGDISNLPASATVFVFARRAGVPMPVAVQRYQPDQLPVEVVFFGAGETATPLQITARLSRGGGVRLEDGDAEASSPPLLPGPQETRIELRIPSL